VLDVGCGSGEFLAYAQGLGAVASGADPAEGMVEIARRTAPDADVRQADFDALPWSDCSFDVVTAFNALHFTDDEPAAIRSAARLLVPGGLLAVVNWAEAQHNDIDAIDSALALADGDEPPEQHDLRSAGALEGVLAEAGLTLVASDLVEVVWNAPDDATLVRGILLGEDAAGLAARSATVIEAAEPYRTAEGGYRLVNAFRFAVARVD
jgi:SAM-dependent methyltransferase